MFTKIYSNLQQAFQLSWFKFLFWNTSLAKLIVQEEKPSAWDFFNTYLSSWWWTRLWFRAFIRNKKHLTEFDQIIKSLQILKNAGIFNEDNFNLILNQAHPNIMASALSTLHQADILTPKNQAIVATDPREWDFILILLNNRGMLTPNNFNLIANHANPRNLAMALSDLQEAGILTPENQAMVTAHANPVHLATAFYFLNHTRILTPENRAIVVAHANPRDLAYALCNLQRAGILTPENRAMVATNANPNDLATAFCFLNGARILTSENQAMVANHANPSDLASALLQLTQRHIRFIVKPNAIILETNEAYLSSKDFVPSSIHHMLIPKEHHLEREKYLNRIIAFFLNKTLKSLPLDVVAYIRPLA